MKKNPKYEDFVGSDYEQPAISSPPKLNKSESSKITENLSKARKAAQDISDSSNDESQNRSDRTKQLSAMKNNLKYEDFVGSDYEQPAISSPPKLNKNESSKITETLSNKTKFIEKQKPRVIDNVKTHISLLEMIILNPPTINDNQKKHLIESAPSTSTGYLHIQNIKNTEELNVINDRSDMILNMLISINQNVTKVLRALGTVTISVDAVSDRLQNIEQDGTQNYAKHNEQFDTLNTFLPLQTKESAMEFDLLLDDAEIRKKLRKYLKNIGENNAKESITRMLAKIFSVTFANSSSWCGQRGNFKVGDMKILSVIKETVRETYPNCTDKYFESEGREWFRQGTQKYMRMQKKSEKNAEILNPVDDVNNN